MSIQASPLANQGSDPHGKDDFPSAVAVAIRARDWPRVRRLCERRVRTTPEDPDAHRHLGQLLVAEGALDDALGKAVDRAPSIAASTHWPPLRTCGSRA
ncbi:hypothetical protein [Pelagibius sp.]|uniref:hypothetical protein n=1 Tax=Pelagibius sp. TaxID=1931238 RepID=UPI003BAE4E8D